MRTTQASRDWLWASAAMLGIATLVLVFFALTKSVSPNPVREIALAPLSEIPDFAQNAMFNGQEAYRFAVANPEVVSQFPCYCGCVYLGHENNYDCYVKEVKADGSLVFEEHATY